MKKCLVYLPVYNGEKYLNRTLKSLIGQTYECYQIVIVNDGSTDSSHDIITRYREGYPDKIIYKKNMLNHGAGNTFYQCYKEHHDADFFCMIGQDDIWPEEYLEKQVDFMMTEECLVVFSGIRYVNDDEQMIDFQLYFHEELKKLSQSQVFLKLLSMNFLCASSSMIRLSEVDKEEVVKYWGYNNDRLQDHELWLNLIQFGKFDYNEDIVISYRIHSENLSSSEHRVIQDKLENYGFTNRVLFSGQTEQFIQSQENVIEFIEEMLCSLESKVAHYFEPMELLLISFCERMLNLGYFSEKIVLALNRYYMKCGILSKCLSGGRKLPEKIKLIKAQDISDSKSLQLIANCVNVEYVNQDENCENGILVVDSSQKKDIDDLAWYPMYKKEIIILCDEEEIEELVQRIPFALFLTPNMNQLQIEKKIILYVEDKTNLFRNGLYGYKDMYNAFQYEQCQRKQEVGALILKNQQTELELRKREEQLEEIINSNFYKWAQKFARVAQKLKMKIGRCKQGEQK